MTLCIIDVGIIGGLEPIRQGTMTHGSFRDARGLAIGGQTSVYNEEAIKQQFTRLSTYTYYYEKRHER